MEPSWATGMRRATHRSRERHTDFTCSQCTTHFLVLADSEWHTDSLMLRVNDTPISPCRNAKGNTPLAIAASKGFTTTCQGLIQVGTLPYEREKERECVCVCVCVCLCERERESVCVYACLSLYCSIFISLYLSLPHTRTLSLSLGRRSRSPRPRALPRPARI